jgi:cyanuric acid amidohydrolase
MTVTIHPFPLRHAGDAAGLALALAVPGVATARRLVLLAKVPGPATLNDPSRELARMVLRAAVTAAGGDGLLARTRMILSVGCEGVGGAGGWLLADDGQQHPGTPGRLALGTARSEPIPMADRGGVPHAQAVARAVARALDDAGLVPGQVRLVLVKSPVRPDQPDATGRSRGAAALGAGVALGEVAADRIGAAIMNDPAVHAVRAMTMSGTETDRAEVVVLGNRPGAGGPLLAGSGLLRDLIDVPGLRRVLSGLGAAFDDEGVLSDPASVPLVLLKAGLAADGMLRGRRTHVFGTDLPADKHLRAAAGGMVAGLLGSNEAFITGGAEHQGPPGACVAAAIIRVGA